MGGQKHVASGVEVRAVFERLFNVGEYQPDGIDGQRSRIRAAGTQSLPLEQPLFATYHALGKVSKLHRCVMGGHTGVFFQLHRCVFCGGRAANSLGAYA